MQSASWPHAPTHQLSQRGTYVVTSATYNKEHHFRGSDRLDVVERGILKITAEYGWRLEAWAVFSNHYHFVAHSPEFSLNGGESLSEMLAILHNKLAAWVNRLDGSRGRKVWHNFWESRMTRQSSYLARLHYVHQNAARHGLVAVGNQYPWCSAAWFERVASPAMVRSIYRFKLDRVNVRDDFQIGPDWRSKSGAERAHSRTLARDS